MKQPVDQSSEEVRTKLIRNDFFWDVRVIHASSASEKNEVICTLTLNTMDDFGQESKIMLEMNPHEMDKFIATLKEKI